MTGTPAEPSARKVEIVVSVPTVAKALGIFFGVLLVYLARDALLSIALSAVFVLGLDPPVVALERRGWGRGRAALVVIGTLVLSVFIIIVWRRSRSCRTYSRTRRSSCPPRRSICSAPRPRRSARSSCS